MMDTIFWLIYVQPLYLVVVEMIFLTILWGLFKNKYGKRLWWKLFNSAIFVITVLAIIYSTIYSRTENFQTPIFIPFHSFLEAKENPELYRTMLMNMFLFAPFGLSLPNILPKKAHPVAATVIIAMLLSVSIEAIQYYLCLGRCEMDDVIFNSLGAFVGTLGFLLFEHLAKDLKNMKNNLTESQKILCNLCGNVLFDKNNNIPEDLDLGELFTEAKHQTVFPIAYMGLKKEKFEKSFYHFVAINVKVDYNHTEIANLLRKNSIKYVFIKGVASASYYNKPNIRTMGDVDVLINRYDNEKVHNILQSLGYTTNDDIFKENGHIVYKRGTKGSVSVCEVHFTLNGIPISLKEVFEKYISNILDNAREITVADGKCLVPSDFHHGIILLLHTANHLTREGVGLRHLLDWAVFANKFSNDEFVSLFEIPLKEMGLWRFAQLLTLCCERYLGIDKKQWTG